MNNVSVLVLTTLLSTGSAYAQSKPADEVIAISRGGRLALVSFKYSNYFATEGVKIVDIVLGKIVAQVDNFFCNDHKIAAEFIFVGKKEKVYATCGEKVLLNKDVEKFIRAPQSCVDQHPRPTNC